MGRSVRVLSVAAIAATSVFMAVAPAGASARVVSHRAGSAAATAPNSDLSGKAKTAKFTPAKLTASVYTAKQCAKATPPVSFTLTNAGKGSYDITYNGGVVFTVPKKSIENVCVSGPTGTITLGISGSTHTLKVKLVKPA